MDCIVHGVANDLDATERLSLLKNMELKKSKLFLKNGLYLLD